jgi:hypothetical protein
MSLEKHRLLAPLLSALLLPTLAQADTYVQAKGTIVVWEDGAWQPLRDAKIELMDSDFDTDDTIDTGYTNADGKFELEGYGGDSGSDSIKKPDIYVKLWLLHNGLADITDEVGFTHTCRTETLEEFNGGTHNFGQLHCEEVTPSILYYRSMFERSWFKQQTGDSFPGGEINVHYPNWIYTGNYTFYDTVHINEASSIFHELGHVIRDELDGDLVHWNWDNASFVYASPGHNDFTVANTQGFAFHEGFAKFHKSYFDATLRTKYQNWTPVSGGEYCEGNVAHDLVLMSERKCTDGTMAGFWRMYQTLKQNPGYIHSRHQFEERFERLFPECRDTGTSQQEIVTGNFSHVISKTLLEYLDWVDSNSAAQWVGRMPSWLPREAQHIFDLSENERHNWDTTARATYRAIAADGARYFEQWFRNGTLADKQLEMRARIVTTVATQRIAELTSIRAVLARDIESTPPGPLRDFYVNRDAGYERLISSLQAALAAPTTGPMPEGILPASFSSPMAIAR